MSRFISATHDESAPDTLGISGVNQTTSGVDAYYVDFLVARAGEISRTGARGLFFLSAFEPYIDTGRDEADHSERNAQNPQIAALQMQQIAEKPDDDEVNQKG